MENFVKCLFITFVNATFHLYSLYYSQQSINEMLVLSLKND